jgi:co-chaperonin GroES (HSP10)
VFYKRMNVNVKLFGDRILFKPIEQEVVGSIVLPQKENKSYELGEVLQVGDGKGKDALGNPKQVPILVKPGDYIWFQVNPFMIQNSVVKFEGKTYMTIAQHDMIARLKSPTITMENFEILGIWTLLDTFEDRAPNSLIVIPDTASADARMLRYTVKQKGALVTDVEVGQEIIFDKKMAQLVAINNKPFFYLDSRYIYGIVEPAATA